MRKLLHRPRRLRRSPALRNLVRETKLTAHDFVLPLFVSEKIDKQRPIASMPGVFQLSVKEIVDEAQRAQDLGLQAVLLFGIPEHKDEQASGAYAENGIVQKALRAIKSKCPDLVTITDVCLCEYMSHGHCGVARIDGDHFHILNDETVELLVKTAISHAVAGVDMPGTLRFGLCIRGMLLPRPGRSPAVRVVGTAASPSAARRRRTTSPAISSGTTRRAA